MRFLVTGGAGRLGVELVKLFTTHNHTVRVLDLQSANWRNIEDIKGVDLVKGSITDPRLVSKVCSDIDAVIHLAAILPPKSEENEKITSQVNVEGTRILCEELRKKEGLPMIFTSSISVYGITATENPPLKESHQLRAHNFYSNSKIIAEDIIKTSKLPYVILRLAPISVVDLIELPEVLPYRIDQRVEFIIVNDAARALFNAAINSEASLGTFNIAGGSTWRTTGGEYISKVYDALGVEVDPVFSEKYSALDWYDTSGGRFLKYQKVSFNEYLAMLKTVGEELGLR